MPGQTWIPYNVDRPLDYRFFESSAILPDLLSEGDNPIWRLIKFPGFSIMKHETKAGQIFLLISRLFNANCSFGSCPIPELGTHMPNSFG